MHPRPSPKPAASPELLDTLLGPHQPSPPPPHITIHVAPGATLNLNMGHAPAGPPAIE